jgi:uroporphyrinogen decarboxylase
LLGLMTEAGADVIGVDWRIPLEEARVVAGAPVTVQGNLDPAACLAPWNVVEEKTLAVLDSGGGRSHVFNLGHGVLAETDPDVLARVVDIVHGWQPV